MTDETLAEFQYQLTDYSKDIPDILSFSASSFMTKAMRNWTEKEMYGRVFSPCD